MTMNSIKQVILFVSIYDGFKSVIVEYFPEFYVAFALSREEGEKLFDEHKENIALVVTGTLVHLNAEALPLSIPLVEKIKRERPSTHIIGMTSVQDFKEKLLKAGCDEVCTQHEIVSRMKHFTSSLSGE